MTGPFAFDEASQAFYRPSPEANRALEFRGHLAAIVAESGAAAAEAEARAMVGAALRHIMDAGGLRAGETMLADLRHGLDAWVAANRQPQPGEPRQ